MPGVEALADLAEAMSSPEPGAFDAALGALDPDGLAALEELIGRRSMRAVRRYAEAVESAEATRRGTVVLLPGVMGSDLAMIDDAAALLWFSVEALAGGGIARLALPIDGSPASALRPGGLLRLFYLPLYTRLALTWRVRLLPYDWRLDIDELADQLAGVVHSLAGEPVHLVAHSMAGVVARAMARRHPDVWNAMQVDVDGEHHGGRLVMLGTPNLGTFAPALAFTGRDPRMRALQELGPGVDGADIATVLATFPALYQMLPAPGPGALDDLYDAAAWPSSVVHQSLFDRARAFHETADTAVDDRTVYVGGAGRETVDGVELRGPALRWRRGSGDGIVPAALGPLPGGRSYWTRAGHGGLAKDARVLDAIDELLVTGTTSLLDTDPADIDGEPGWIDDVELEADRLAHELVVRAARHDVALFADLLPVVDDEDDEPHVRLAVEVVWGDIAAAGGDVVAVGHYQDVSPTAAEGSLDAALSGSCTPEQRVLGVATSRGVLKGIIGEVNLFPWSRAVGGPALAAVVGLGRPGGFGLTEHEVLVRNLLWTAERVAGGRTLDMVLIGSGGANLSITETVESLVRSIDIAVGQRDLVGRLATLRIVEHELGRAEAILRSLTAVVDGRDPDRPAVIDVRRSLIEGAGGAVSEETALTEALVALTAQGETAAPAVVALDLGDRVRDEVLERLRAIGDVADFEVRRRAPEGSHDVPARLSCLVRDGEVWASAISDAATVSERRLGLEVELFRSLVAQVNTEAAEDLRRAGDLLLRVAVPADLRPFLRQGQSTVIEVDRVTAALPWEILCVDEGADAGGFLGLRSSLARQLRTTLSPPPVVTGRVALRRVLVVADPGAPGGGGRLPGARAEAERVVTYLRRRGVRVDFLLGSTDDPGGDGAATVANLLHHLLEATYDVVHYSGHGTFSTDDAPGASGWVLADGGFTGAHLTMLERLPPLIVANACHSSRLTTGLPGLADQFLGRGLLNLVGTSREVGDAAARTFSETFYRALLAAGAGTSAEAGTLGEAVMAGRVAIDGAGLADWDAYQLYGNPEFRFWHASVDADDPWADGT